MGFRQFQIKIVRHDRPDDEGRWIERVVPDEWPGDDKAGSHMLRTPPEYDAEIMPGYHAVQIVEVQPAPPDQPGSMREMAGLPAGDFDLPQPGGYRMR